MSELESIKCLIDEGKVLNADLRLGQLIKKSGLEKPELEDIRALLKYTPQGNGHQLQATPADKEAGEELVIIKAGKRGDQVEDMRVLEKRRALRLHYHRLYAILWLFITFLSIPYLLAAVNLSPSQFFLLDRIFVDIQPGIHHGLLGYTTLSIGILGMRSSTHIQRGLTRRYLFFISLFFLAKGMYFFAEDLIGEQIVHHTVEQTYLWDWTAPRVEFFTLTVALVAIWMKGTWTILAMAIPVLFISIFATPCAAITVGYLILLLIYMNEEAGKTPWLTKGVENWKLFRRFFRLAWVILILLSIGMLLAVLGVNL